MVVTIKSSCLITPANDTPSCRLPLSECDQSKFWDLAPVVYIYKPSDFSKDASDTIKSSLSQALIHFYPLAGRLKLTEGGRFEIECSAMGALYFEAETQENLAHFGDFIPSKKLQQLVPKIDYSCLFEKLPLLQLQVTRFCCGGLALGVSISHVVADGWSTMQFTNSWAKLARGKDFDMVPFHDRTILRPSQPLIPPRFPHVEFEPKPLLLNQSNDSEERKKTTSVVLLEITKFQVERLKKIANEGRVTMIGRPYSRFEAIAAHLWGCLCKARESLDYFQPTIFCTMGDSRQRLKEPLPKGYFGNASFSLVSPKCVAGELACKPLSYAAEKIRKTIESFTDKYIESTLDFIKSQDDVTWLRPSFHIEGPKHFIANPNLSVTSWINLPIYDVDFGWGKPMYVTPAALEPDGKCFILPSPRCDGSLILTLYLQSDHVNSFKILFYQDLGHC